MRKPGPDWVWAALRDTGPLWDIALECTTPPHAAAANKTLNIVLDAARMVIDPYQKEIAQPEEQTNHPK
jgi:hypothetical protein